MRPSLLALALLLLPFSARAINQPNGTRIPVNNELQTVFSGRGDMIRAQDDAAVTPERFVPGCTLTFTFLTRGGAAFRNVFGWYNVTGARPDPSDLHPLIPCDAQPGNRYTLNLRGNPAYRGGEIGFFLRTPEDGTSGGCSDCCAAINRTAGHTFYSERAFNPDNMGANSYIHLLIYDSRATPNAFYFAWEDLYSGGDNNFTDFVALVESIVCAGAGAQCDTGQRGACAAGVRQCRNGALTCMPTVTSTAERCDGVDNDCNGMVDDGTNLCDAARVCDRGVCVDRCRSELGCFEGEVCTDRGTCVQQSCATVTCMANQRCEAGRCVGLCDGITCPRAQVCRAGRCVEACAGVTCDSDQACVDGACVPRCECRRCATGQTCGSDGRCRESACATVTCATGQVCVSGRCVDACDGARCPTGERCARGQCEPIPVMDGGTRRDAAPDLPPVDVRFPVLDSGVVVTDAGVDAGKEKDAGTSVEPTRPGCACRTAGAGERSRGGAKGVALLLGALALARVRRRRAR